MINKLKIRKVVIITVAQVFLLTNIAYSWSLLPCTPNCGSSSNDEAEPHHATMHPDSHTDHNNATAQNSIVMVCGNCGSCDDIYTSLFNLITTPDGSSIIARPDLTTAQFILNIKSHIPDPYQPPPI